ncbi:MAG TPA: oligosaccharide repeat unit polymerase [Firmicutes bacterium]|nr:oligosaccharide repeat unit polymerase [Bacillota bacterium]
MIVVFAIMLAMLACINACIARSFLYPPAVFAALWSGLLFALAVSGDVFYTISPETMLVYLLGATAFSMGGFIALVLWRDRSDPRPILSPSRRAFVRRMLGIGLILLTLAFPFYWHRLQRLSAESDFTNFWVGVRYQIAYGEGLGVFGYLIALARFLALIAFYENDGSRTGRTLTFAIIVLAFIYDLLTVARVGLYALIFGLIGISWMRSRRVTLKPLLAGIAAFLPAFAGAAVVLGKGGNVNATVTENLAGVLRSLQVYALGGLVAFDKVVRDPWSFQGPRITTLRFFFAVANALGAHFDLPRVIPQYTMTPAPTNVYTIYFSYFLDYGWVGVGIIMFILGNITARLYQAAARGNPQAVILYGVMFWSLMVSCAAEGFFISLSYWIQAVLYTFLLYHWPLSWGRYGRLPVKPKPSNVVCQQS